MFVGFDLREWLIVAWVGVCPGEDVVAGQAGVGAASSMIFLGGSMASLARMSRWAGVSSVRWRKVPAGPWKTPMLLRRRSPALPTGLQGSAGAIWT